MVVYEWCGVTCFCFQLFYHKWRKKACLCWQNELHKTGKRAAVGSLLSPDTSVAAQV